MQIIWLGMGATLIAVMAHAPMPLAPWLALPLLLHASRSLPPLGGLPALWIVLFIAIALGNRGMLPVSGPGYFFIAAFYATTMAVPFAIDRAAAPRFDPLSATLIFPAAFAAVEFLRARFTPSATWGSIAYTQFGELPLMQLAAFTGLWGITFLIAWFASTADVVWRSGVDWTAIRTPAVAFSAVFVAVMGAGNVRVASAPTDRRTLRVAALNRPADLFAPGEMTRIAEGRLAPDERIRLGVKLARLHDAFLDGSRKEARAGARLIAFPEQNLLIFKEDEAAFLERARRLAADEAVYLAIGMGTVYAGDGLPFENKLILIDPAGAIVMSYLKSHAVAGWEASIMKPGDRRMPVVVTGDGRFAGAICFDADFPDFIRQAGSGLADLLIVPANEWLAIKQIHVQMAAFRAVENGVPLLRPAASGLSAVFDQWGRVLAMADYFAPGDRTMTAQVPLGRVQTLYAQTGDLFAWVCVTGIVLALLRAGAALWGG